MTRTTPESIAETVAVLLILFAPGLGGVMTLIAALMGIVIALIATGKRVTPAMVLAALSAFAVGLLVTYAIRVA